MLPWQQYTVDVANERRPDGSYEYQVVVVTVPRQSGKTTLVRANGVHTCVVCGRDVFYTAQTGKDARARWMDLVKVLRLREGWKDRIEVALRGGSEHVTFPGGNVFQVFAPLPESLHGYTPPKVKLDEVFSYTAVQGELLMGAIEPAQFTIVDKQIWIVSTMGTELSTFLHDWIDRGMDGMPRVACFYWGAGDAHDTLNAEHVADFHPAVGFQLGAKIITPADIIEAAEHMSRAEYDRAYGNRRTVTAANLIPLDTWRSCGPLVDENGDPINVIEPPADRADISLSYDVALDRQSAAIVASWVTPADRVATMIVQAGPGVTWLAGAVDQLDRSWRPAEVVAAGNGPVLDVTAQLRDLGVDVTELGEREYAAASGHYLTLLDDRRLLHDGNAALERSVTGLVTRAVADAVAFSRRHSVGDSAPAIGSVVGTWAAARREQNRAPSIHFG